MKNYNNIYIAVQIKENDKLYAYVIKTTDNNNLISVLDVPNIITANVYPKQKAYNVVEFWNNIFKENGTYMFDEPSF